MMFPGLDAAISTLNLPSLGGAVGLLSVGVWLIRLQRIAAFVRLAGLLLVALGLVLVAGGSAGVLDVDVAALRALLDAGARVLGDVLAAVTAGGGA